MPDTLSIPAAGTLAALEDYLAQAMRCYAQSQIEPPHGIQIGVALSTAKALCTAARNHELFRQRAGAVRSRGEGT